MSNWTYLRIVWRFLERDWISRKRLFLMVSFLTLPTALPVWLVESALLTRELLEVESFGGVF